MPAPQHRPSHPNVQEVNDPSIPQKREVRDKVPAPVRPIPKDENRNNEPKRREEDKENRQPHAHHPHPHGHHAHHPSQPIHHGHHGAPPPPPPPPPPPRQPHHENGGRAHGHRPDAAHGQGRPHVEPTKPAPMSEEKAIEKAKAMLGERIQQLGGDADPAKWRVGIHKGTMEFTFPYPRNPPLSDTLQIISQSPISGAKCECGVSFRTSHTVVRIPCRTTPTLEVMIPMEKNKLAMVHADMICFGPNEVELAAKLYIHGNSENKGQPTQPQQAGKKPQKADGKQDNDTIPEGDMPLEDVREKLVELGVQVFMPAVLSPALKEKEAATNNKAKCFNDASVEKLWAGIGGYLEVKASVKQTITLPLLRPDLFTRMALLARKGEGKPKCTAGVLFTGPPGVGKTTMAKVAAHAAGVPLIYVPVESIMSKWYGEAEQRLRKVFDLARKIPRSALFLDELDAFAGSRDRQMHEATRRILSVLLRQLDGLENENVETETAQSQQKSFFMVVVGATNRPEDLDAALMSRFDQSIEFPLPSESERAAIFGTYAAVLNSSDLNQLAKASPGCAGRDIVEICRQAERIWLYKLLNSESGIPLDMSASQLRPPPVSVYLEAVSNHKAGNAPQ